jgi:4-amino-4-deoxy-L-arabinose transferase-like glycosyltransferase
MSTAERHPAAQPPSALIDAEWLALALVVFLALAIGREHPLQNLNEGVYARVAQEMLERRDFVVPMLDGVPYLEKPPLLYWITAACYALFGVNESAARIASLLGAALSLGAAAAFARRHLAARTDRVALAILASAPIVLVMGRAVMFDMLFTGVLFCALVALYEAFVAREGMHWVRWSYALLAAAVLAKGLAALVFYGLVAGAFAASLTGAERIAFTRRLGDRTAIAIFVAIAFPWHVWVGMSEPGFLWFYFVNEHVLRFIDARFPRDYHTGPLWYFLWRVPLYVFPWALLLVLPAANTGLGPQARSARRFLWLAFAVPLVVFSLSRAKAEYYMVVGAPALALLAADRFARASERARRIALVVLAGAVGGVAAGLALVSPAWIAPYALPPSRPLLALFAAALATLTLVAALRRRPMVALLACAAVSLPCIAFFSDFIAANEALKSSRTLAQDLLHGGGAVYIYGEFESLSALPFYLDRWVGVVDSHSDDLRLGMQLMPQPQRFPDARAMRQMLADDSLWLVVPDAERQAFLASGLAPMLVREKTIGRSTLYASQPLARSLEAGARNVRLRPRPSASPLS